MGRRKKSLPAHVVAEDESPNTPEEEPARVLAPLPDGAISQTDAARVALDKGYEKPIEAVAFIKKTFGIDVNPQYFSAIKTRKKGSQEPSPKKAATATKGKRGPKPRTPLVEGYVAPPEKPKAAGEPDMLLALEGVKELVSQFGADKVRRMVDLIG